MNARAKTELEEREPEDFTAFLSGLGTVKQVKIVIHRRNPDNKKIEYARASVYDIDDADPIEELYDFYPEGGEFRIQIQDNATKKHLALFWTTLAKRNVPVKEITSPAGSRQSSDRSDKSNTDFMLAMMQMNQQSQQNTMQMLTGVLTAMMAGNNKNASDPAALLDSVINAHKSLAPQGEQDNFDRWIDRVSKLRDITEVREGPGGIIGAVGQMLPALAAMAAHQPQPQPNPYGYAQLPAPQATPPQTHMPPQPQPQGPDPVISKLKAVIDMALFYIRRDLTAESTDEDRQDIALDICDNLVMQRSTGQISDEEITVVLSQKNQLSSMLTFFGVTDQNHVDIFAAALALFEEALADQREAAGEGGGQADAATHGAAGG